jgi:hypothetical protein
MKESAHVASGLRVGRAVRRDTEALEGAAPVRWLIRAGFVARGVTYGVIGALALAIAVGAGSMGATPNQQGALALIAGKPLGRVALVVICAGLLAYALWKLTQGVAGRGPEGGGGPGIKDRVSDLAGGVAYLVFFAVAVGVLTGSAGSSSGTPREAAAGVLGWPGGQLIVGISGAVLAAISLYQMYDGISGGFAGDSKIELMGGTGHRLFMLLGRVGLTARALVFALIGYFLVRTAVEFDPGSTVGVDGALARLHHEPLGTVLLGLVAAGLLIFAAFSMLEARYRRL